MVGHKLQNIRTVFHLFVILRIADNSKDVSDEETIAQLKLALFDLTESHKKLCDEMAFLSGYVALHERALQVTLRSHDWRRNLLRAHHRHQKETHMTGGDRQDDSDTNSRAESAHQSLPQVNNGYRINCANFDYLLNELYISLRS